MLCLHRICACCWLSLILSSACIRGFPHCIESCWKTSNSFQELLFIHTDHQSSITFSNHNIHSLPLCEPLPLTILLLLCLTFNIRYLYSLRTVEMILKHDHLWSKGLFGAREGYHIWVLLVCLSSLTACSHLVPYVRITKKKRDERETAILTMAVVTAMWGSSANGDARLWVTIV